MSQGQVVQLKMMVFAETTTKVGPKTSLQAKSQWDWWPNSETRFINFGNGGHEKNNMYQLVPDQS
ncbi:hypothetical protein CREGCYN_14940 [Synechococcus sp. M16CYN]